MTDEEEIIGTVEAKSQGDASSFIIKSTGDRVLCPRCRKNQHNQLSQDGTGVITTRCKGGDCECKCRTHYIGKDGRARPIGVKDDSFAYDLHNLGHSDEIERFNSEWMELHKDPRESDKEEE